MVKELTDKLFYYDVYYSRQSFRDVKNQREIRAGIYGVRAPIAELNMELIASSDQEAEDTFIEWLVKQHKGKEKYPQSYVNLVKSRFKKQREVVMPPDSFYKITEMIKHPLDEFPILKGLVLKVFEDSKTSQTPSQ